MTHRRWPLRRDLLVGAGDFGEECTELAGILFAGLGFDAARDVHRIGANGEDGFSNIFRSETAGEKDGEFGGGAFCDFPIGDAAGAAELLR